MAFVTHLDASAQTNRRDSRRRRVDRMFSVLSSRDAALTVVVHDISETGFRAEFASELEVGDEVRLRLGRGELAPARVMWREGWDHGCRFVTPLTEEEIDAALGVLTPVVTDEAPAPSSATEPLEPEQPRRKRRRLTLLIVALVLLGEFYLIAHLLL